MHRNLERSGLFRKLVVLVLVVTAGMTCLTERLYAQSEYATKPPAIRAKNNEMIPPTAFPGPDTELRTWACLVSLDPINRRGILRLEDRDRMLEFTLLPSAPLFYRGAPASLSDFPPGTMVEVWGYGDESTQLPRNLLRISDAFSIQAFSQKSFQVEKIDLDKRTFTAKPVSVENRSVYRPHSPSGGTIASLVDESPVQFSFNDQTDWYLGSTVADSSDLMVGQLIKVNFIRKFYEGPPLITRCTEVWLDEESQNLATKRQLSSFVSYLRDRGFPLRVDAVDDGQKRVTVTLLETGLNEIQSEWKVGQKHDFAASTTTLRMWEPNGGQSVPDRMFGVTIEEMTELPIGYGCGGVKMVFSVPRLYEAYRPGTIIKLYPSGHPVPILPIEERMPKEFDTFLRP